MIRLRIGLYTRATAPGVCSQCVCVHSVCIHCWVCALWMGKCRTQIPSMGHRTWLYVTSLFFSLHYQECLTLISSRPHSSSTVCCFLTTTRYHKPRWSTSHLDEWKIIWPRLFFPRAAVSVSDLTSTPWMSNLKTNCFGLDLFISDS